MCLRHHIRSLCKGRGQLNLGRARAVQEPEHRLTQEIATQAAPVLPTVGCQPNSSFPGKRYEAETFEWSFQPGWFLKWQWLHYLLDKTSFFSLFAARQERRVSATLKERLLSSQMEDFATGIRRPPSLPTMINLSCIWNQWECCRLSATNL